jgi:hypothetical protein
LLASFSDPFEALFAFQRVLDTRVAGNWMGHGVTASGGFQLSPSDGSAKR